MKKAFAKLIYYLEVVLSITRYSFFGICLPCSIAMAARFPDTFIIRQGVH